MFVGWNSAKDYFENYDKGMKRQIEKELFSENYHYPTGVQLELTYKCNHRLYIVIINLGESVIMMS